MPAEVLQGTGDNNRSKVTEAVRRHGIRVEGLDFDTATMLNSVSLKKCRVWVLNAVIMRDLMAESDGNCSYCLLNVTTETDGKDGEVGDLRVMGKMCASNSGEEESEYTRHVWQGCPWEVSGCEFEVRSIHAVVFLGGQGSLRVSCYRFSLLLFERHFSLPIGCLDNLWPWRGKVQGCCCLESQPGQYHS